MCPLPNIRWNVGEVTLASRCKKDEITITEFKAPALNRRERHLYGPVQPLKSKDFLKSIVFSVRIRCFSVDRRAKQRNIYAFLYLVWTGSKFAVTFSNSSFMVAGTRRLILPYFSSSLITLEGGVRRWLRDILFDKYYAKCGNTLCAVCGLAKALITLRSSNVRKWGPECFG